MFFLLKLTIFVEKHGLSLSLHLVEHCFPICSLHFLGKDQYLFFIPLFKFSSQASICIILVNTRYLNYKSN